MDRKVLAGVVLVLGVYFHTSVNGLECLSCNATSDINHCLSQRVQCIDGQEQCFLDRILNPDLKTVFNAGCRAKMVCDLVSSFGKRSEYKRQITGCTQCCNTSPEPKTNIPCNGFLCNQGPVRQETTCAICDRIHDFHNCETSQQCLVNEVCSVKIFISGSTPLYELGCQQKTVCDAILRNYKATHVTHRPAGRADHGDSEICAACCTGLNCNKAICFELLKNQTCFDMAVCGP